MRKIALLFAFLFVSFVSVSAQNINGTEIKDREIEWSDFVGEPDRSSKFDAVTNWTITYSFSRPVFDDDEARVKATVRLFLRADSWVKPNKQSARLLNHERGHFKIGQICAKEIAETINSTVFDREDYKEQINAVYWEIINKYKEIEKQYDRETDHYRNETQQALWDEKLDEMLEQ